MRIPQMQADGGSVVGQVSRLSQGVSPSTVFYPPSNFDVPMILRSIDTGGTPEETGETPAPLPDRGLRMENFGAGRNGG